MGIDPDQLVWVEHYGTCFGNGHNVDTLNRVTFTRLKADNVRWLASVPRNHPDGWPGYSDNPAWTLMTAGDWAALGLEPWT